MRILTFKNIFFYILNVFFSDASNIRICIRKITKRVFFIINIKNKNIKEIQKVRKKYVYIWDIRGCG